MATDHCLLAAAHEESHHHHHRHNHNDNHHHHNHQHEHHFKMTANMLQDSLDHHHNHHQHERAPSVTSDQYSSLNLSSVGSSAAHSPVIEHLGAPTATCAGATTIITTKSTPERARLSELVMATALTDEEAETDEAKQRPVSSLTSSSALSDYHGSLPCSPVESTGSPPAKSVADELLMLGLSSSAAAEAPQARPRASLAALSDNASLQFGGKENHHHHHHHHLNNNNHHHHHHHPRPSSAIAATAATTTTNGNSNNNNNHLHPDAHQQQQPQKARSYSHSTAFSPLVGQAAKSAAAAAAASKGSTPSTPASKSPNGAEFPLQQGAVIVERPRRLSRIENRQSLHDLGYGRIESYFKLQRLGKGTYATVYMGRSKLSNDLVALKEILKEHDEGAPCTAIREVSLLRLLRHNNIVTLHDICHTPKKLTLVFEYVGPDLYAYMKENNHLLSIHNVRLLLYQLLRGIAFCHSRQVLHRDLKPQNLLINSRGELRICDFGLARAKSIPTKSYSNEVVTLWYRPPDVLLGNTDYDHSIDMWGVGCIFYEMASGRTFFPGSSVRQQLYLIFSSLGAPSQANWPEILTNPEYLSYSFPAFRPEKLAHRVPRLDQGALQLLQSFLRFKPSERISADEARRDPFFACLPERVHQLSERESIFDVPGVYMTLNPGQKLNHHHSHNHSHHHHHRQHRQSHHQ